MNTTLLKSLLACAPTSLLLAASIRAFGCRRTVGSCLQLLGAGCLLLVVLTHVCEALDLLPRMQWGCAHSLGHYLDLSSAVLGLTLVPIGYGLQVLAKRYS
jgi:hypothetical protein